MTISSIFWILLAVAAVSAEVLHYARLKARPIQPNLTMAEAWDKFVTDLEKGDVPYGDRQGEEPVLERMRELRASGVDFDRIAATLNAEGVPTRAGERWHGFMVKFLVNQVVGQLNRKAAYKSLSLEQRQELKDNLLDIERLAAASQRPMIAIREAAIKALTAYVIAEEFMQALDDAQRSALEAHFGPAYSKGSMCRDMFFSDFTSVVLRDYYAKPKYDDATNHDWFDYYYASAKHLAAGRIKCMAQVAVDPTDTLSSFLADQYVNLFEQLKDKVLNSPRKTPLDFPKSANPIALPEPPSQTRTRKTVLGTNQIDALSALMEQRLTGILSGDLYVAEGVRAPSAGDYFGLDAGILLSLLTVNLADGVDSEQYWKQIISPVLSKVVPNLTPKGIEDVLGTSRAYRDRWLKHEPDDAPLAEILPFGIAAAYNLLDALNSESFNGIWKRVFPTVVDGATKLVERFYRIFDSPEAS